MRNRKEKRVYPGKLKVTADEALAKLLEEEEKQVAKWSRIDAEKLLVQVEDALAKLCEDNNVAKAANQIITERSSHIPPYTPEQVTVWYRERREYEEATVAIREFYGSLTQFLTRVTHEPDSYVGRGVWRILDSYHPNLRFRFYQVKAKRKHGR